MTVAEIRKVEIVTLKDNVSELLKRIQKTGAVHIESLKEEGLKEEINTAEMDKKIGDLESVIKRLKNLEEGGENFVQSFFDSRENVKDRDFAKALESFDFKPVDETKKLIDREKEINNEAKKLHELRERLTPYTRFDVDLLALGESKDVVASIGYVNTSESDLEELAKINEIYFEEISRSGNNVYAFIIRPKECELKEFVEAKFPGQKGRPADIIRDTEKRLKAHEKVRAEITESAKVFLKDLNEIEMVYDGLLLERERIKRFEDLAETKSAAMLGGYVKAKELQRLRKTIESKEVAVFDYDAKEDEAPVALENRPFIRPFEVLTSMYGPPKYKSIDPTPFFAIPFAIFFGFCLGDVGYGAVLLILSLVLPKKVKMGSNGRALFKILFYSSIFTMIVGALTGSIFGNAFDYLPEQNVLRVLRDSIPHLSVLEHSEHLMILLMISIVIGLLYTGFGYAMACCMKIKRKEVIDGMLDSGIWAIISFSPILWIATGNMLAFIYILMAGILIVLFTHGRKQKKVYNKVIYGITGLYGFINILSDSLSFLRLFGLGLSTYVISYVFNVMGDMASGIPYIGFLLLPIILLVGYAFTFIMSSIGAFIHSLRLQYVEFFPKFFEGGEKVFRPFKMETKYFKIRGE